jgi:hypothetical protein
MILSAVVPSLPQDYLDSLGPSYFVMSLIAYVKNSLMIEIQKDKSKVNIGMIRLLD